MSGIVLDSITKEFPGGVVAVRDLSLEVAPGEFVVLVGPSGCGKTTSLRMVAGLEEVSSGEIRIGGRVVTSLPPRKRDVAMVFQNYALYAHMTVRANMAFGLRMAKLPKPEQRRRVEHAARMMGITELLDRKPKQLSGGQRQRVAMGRAIVREPAAFLMDEPLSNLDAKLRVEMRSEISSLQRRIGTPTLYVTHDQTEAMTMGDRLAIMRDGDLVQLGTPEEVYEYPADVFVASFIGSPAMNLIEGLFERLDDGFRVSFGGSYLQVPNATLARCPALAGYAGRRLIVGVRPEDLELTDHISVGNGDALEVTVARAESLGSEQIVYFHPQARDGALDGGAELTIGIEDSPTPSRVLLRARLGGRHVLAENGRVRLGVDLDRLYFFHPESGEAVAR
jgi:multiple sugar transport system ATP-binding protein